MRAASSNRGARNQLGQRLFVGKDENMSLLLLDFILLLSFVAIYRIGELNADAIFAQINASLIKYLDKE